jgi:cell division protein FtsB
MVVVVVVGACLGERDCGVVRDTLLVVFLVRVWIPTVHQCVHAASMKHNTREMQRDEATNQQQQEQEARNRKKSQSPWYRE